MPELPEVETIRQDLRGKILHKKIKNVVVASKARVNMKHLDFVKLLKNKEFSEIDRIGKLMIFGIIDSSGVKRSGKMSRANFAGKAGTVNFANAQFATPLYLLVHLKMTGQLIYQRGQHMIGGGHSDSQMPVKLPDNFTRATFEFSDGGKLFFNDMRRFGYLKIVSEDGLNREKEKYGIEPLQTNFTLENFINVLQDRKTSIKAVLLNQKLISGIGNIYADEACFLAGIKPSTQVSKLTSTQVKKLYKSIMRVIKLAIDKRGTTFNHYRDSDGNTGNFVKYLKVYGRAKERCKKCNNPLKSMRVAGRGTVFCEVCQK